MEAGDKWLKLEETVRKVLREELDRLENKIEEATQKKTPRVGFADGKFTGLTDVHWKAFKEAYPALDLDDEIRRCAAYVVNNPQRAPKSQYGRFLNAWLARSQDRIAIRSIPAKPEVKEIHRRACAYCSLDAVGTVNAINHCRGHYEDAYYEKPRRMLGVVPKPVAGND